MNSTTKIPPPEVSRPCPYDLLTDIAVLKDSTDPTETRQAGDTFKHLLHHYGGLLMAMATREAPFSGATVHLDPDDLYSQLVFRIWDKADQFKPQGKNPKGIQSQFIAWSAKILKHIVSDTIAPLKMQLTSTETLGMGWDAFADEQPEPSERAKIVAEILDEMDPDDAEILRWTALVKPLDGSQMRPDPNERLALCRKLNVTEAGLRKKRERALKAFSDELKARLS